MIDTPTVSFQDDEIQRCVYCPVSELQLAVLLGRSEPHTEPLWTEIVDGPELRDEVQRRLTLLLRIYQTLRQAAPRHYPDLANRWVFQPGVLEPITEDSIMEYLLAAPSTARFEKVHRFLEGFRQQTNSQ